MGKVKIGVGFSVSRAGIPGPEEICAFDLTRWTHVAGWAARLALRPGFKAPFALLSMQDAEVP